MGKGKLYTLYRRPGSPNWWFHTKPPGFKRIRRSSRLSDRKAAEGFARRISLKLWKSYTDGEQATLTFSEAVMLYEGAGKPDDYLIPLTRHLGQRRVASITAGEIKAAAQELYPNGSPATWNRNGIVPARAVINHCAELGKCPYIRVKMFKVIQPAKRAVNEAWVRAFIASAENPRIAALEYLMWTTAARISQALSRTWEDDVLLNEALIRIPAAKGFPERWAHLTPEMVAMLANLPGEKTGLVFGYVYRWSVYKPWKATCERAGIPYIPPHQSGRHSFFTETIARNKVDPTTAAKLGGSASPHLLFKTYVHTEDETRSVIEDVFGTKRSQRPKNASRKSANVVRKTNG
jgi:integrase